MSNLVFHNLGTNRFKAYDNVIECLNGGAYFILIDLLPEQSFAFFTISAIGIFTFLPVFWNIPQESLTKESSAASIGLSLYISSSTKKPH